MTDDAAKPRRPETKTIQKTKSSGVSAKDDGTKPRRTATQSARPAKTDALSGKASAPNPRGAKISSRENTKSVSTKAPAHVRGEQAKSRQSDSKTTRHTNINGVSVKDEAGKPRRPDTKATPKTKSRGAPVQGDATHRSSTKTLPKTKGFSLQDEAAKPRRVGTKMSRLLDLNPGTTPAKERGQSAKPRQTSTGKAQVTQWLLYCRPGFEQDCVQEAVGQARSQRPVLAEQPDIIQNSGHAVIAINEQTLSYNDLIFARQLIRLHHTIEELSERDRLTPILSAINALPGKFGAMWLEVPDTNDGKTLSAFTRRFQPLLETALREQGRLADEIASESSKLPRLHVFFPDKSSALIGTSDPYNSAASIMGIVRQSMPSEAPSRSTMKLAEAIEVFLDKSEQTRLLRSGMTAVDLGAAPGGWTWQMVRRGIRVTAVDNGPMKGVMDKHPMVEHLKQDGFKFAPKKSVDWLICDMVEKPSKVAELIGNWFAAGWCRNAIFNLKLPMKQRVTALDTALGGIRSRLEMEGINYKMIAKQLYHDREEITVFLSKTKNR